jgi:hypothetical protein
MAALVIKERMIDMAQIARQWEQQQQDRAEAQMNTHPTLRMFGVPAG